MKLKIAAVAAVVVIALATIKTGYSFYEYQAKLSATNQSNETIYAQTQYTNQNFSTDTNDGGYSNLLSQDTSYENSIEDSTQKEDNDSDYGNYSQTFGGGCCGSGAYGMIDENGNFKDATEYEKDLEQAVENGEITGEEKDYYLDLYNQCANYFNNPSTEEQNY